MCKGVSEAEEGCDGGINPAAYDAKLTEEDKKNSDRMSIVD